MKRTGVEQTQSFLKNFKKYLNEEISQRRSGGFDTQEKLPDGTPATVYWKNTGEVTDRVDAHDYEAIVTGEDEFGNEWSGSAEFTDGTYAGGEVYEPQLLHPENLSKTPIKSEAKYPRHSRTKQGSGNATLNDVEVSDFFAPGDEFLLDVDFTYKYWYTPATWNDPEEGDEEVEFNDVRDTNTGKSMMPQLKQKYGAKLNDFLDTMFGEKAVEYAKEHSGEFDSSRFDGPDDVGERI